MSTPILKVENLSQHFYVDRKTTVKAVNNVNFEVYEGETFSVVGESGSGKSTLGRSLIRIYDYQEGHVTFMGSPIDRKMDKKTQQFLRKNMQMIFQDPMASLNPRHKVLDIVGLGIDVNGLAEDRDARHVRVTKALDRVGMPEDAIYRYPHQFSGGQRQRIGIARALVVEPRLIIADEIISALDVSIQAQVVNLMRKLQRKFDLTYIFIAHDLAMVRSISDRIAVMHKGFIVELGTVDDIYNNPIHPYTKALLSAVPIPDPLRERSRHRVTYNMDDIKYEEAEDHYVSPSHRVRATPEHLALWQEGVYENYLQ